MILPIAIILIVIVALLMFGAWQRMLKQMVLLLIFLAVVIGVIGYFKYQSFQQFMAMKDGMSHMKQSVSTIKAATDEWQESLEAVGSLRAVKGVDISNELSGVVDEIHFNSGDEVKQDTLLLTLRAKDDIAKLASLEANVKLAEINYNRDRKQLSVQAVSQSTVDTDLATLQSDQAQAAEQKAVVDKKFIRAPFSGRLGIRNVDLGQYLNPGTAIVTLQQLDPIYLDFNLPQQALSEIHTGQQIAVKNDTYPGRTFDGKIIAVSPKVDANTRNLQIRAEIANPDHALFPGMYATAKIMIGEAKRFVTLPQTVISYNPYGDTVFMILDKGKDDTGQENLTAEQTFVTVGDTRGDQVQILKGVKEGDVVVSSGQLKLQNDTAVTINNSVMPKNDAAPTPEEQ